MTTEHGRRPGGPASGDTQNPVVVVRQKFFELTGSPGGDPVEKLETGIVGAGEYLAGLILNLKTYMLYLDV